MLKYEGLGLQEHCRINPGVPASTHSTNAACLRACASRSFMLPQPKGAYLFTFADMFEQCAAKAP
eukprot:3830830-Amphidinium_carterae.1